MNAPHRVAETYLKAYVTEHPTEEQIMQLGSLLLGEFYRGAEAAKRKMIKNITDVLVSSSPEYGNPEYVPANKKETLPSGEKRDT